jgi:glutathione peroxidase
MQIAYCATQMTINRLSPLIAAVVLTGTALLPLPAQASLCASLPGLARYTVQPLIGGASFDLCKSKAKAVLVVNTASQCGFTPQYEGLEKLHQQYKSRGLLIVAIPANDFGSQESGSNQQIAEFCKINYGVSFPVASKLSVPIGQDPLFAGLAERTGKKPAWNFHKYLLVPGGQPQSFDSAVTPQSTAITGAIEAALR